MNKFQRDLESGMELEVKVLSTLNENWFNLIKNPDKKGMDLLILENWIEVKRDEAAMKTWNAYIEYECNWVASWIFKKEAINLKYWAHSLETWTFLLFDWKTFRKFVKDKIADCNANKSKTSKWFRIVSGWDWNRTKGLLVPVHEMAKLALDKYII